MVFLYIRQINNELSDLVPSGIAYDENIILKRDENFEKKEQTNAEREMKRQFVVHAETFKPVC